MVLCHTRWHYNREIPPQFAAIKEVIVGNGEDAVLEVRFCADPLPEQLWHLGETGDNMILAAGSRHKRFIVNTVRKLKEDCYISTLRIVEVEQQDSTFYQLRLTNSHGTDMHEIKLVVKGNLFFYVIFILYNT